MRVRAVMWVVAAVSITAACGSADADDSEPAEPATPEPVAVVSGALARYSTVIDGVEIDYVAATPVDFRSGHVAPVVLALSGSRQGIELATLLVERVFLDEALERGWVVVSPAAPNDVLFFHGSEELVPGFLEHLETWVLPEGDRYHLAGVSNGGISSLRIATLWPQQVASVTVFPGYPFSDGDQAGLAALTEMPVHLFVGNTTTGGSSPCATPQRPWRTSAATWCSRSSRGKATSSRRSMTGGASSTSSTLRAEAHPAIPFCAMPHHAPMAENAELGDFSSDAA